MTNNCGRTRLKSRKSADPMGEFDALPSELRRWMASAKRPWSARTVHRSYHRAIRKTGDPETALLELTALQDRLLSKDARFVWGQGYPDDPSSPRA